MLSTLEVLPLSLKRKLIRDQTGLQLNSFLRQLGFSLMHIFSIIFIFQFGTSIVTPFETVGGLKLVFYYLFLLYLTTVITIIPLSQYVIRSIGYRKSISLSLVFTSVGYIFLILADSFKSPNFIYLSAVVKGIGLCLYWVTYHTLFIDDIKSETVGKSFGILEVFTKFGQIIAPLIGAFITVFFGFDVLFFIGVLILLSSAVPTLFLKHHLHFDQVSFREFFTWMREPDFFKLSLAIGGRNTEEKLYGLLWPIYIFLMAKSIEGLGLFHSLILISATVCTYLVAKFFDKHSDTKIHTFGVIGVSVIWIARMLAQNIFQLVLFDSLDKFFYAISRTFFFGYLFRRARGRQSFSFVVYWILSETIWLLLALIILYFALVWFGLIIFWMTFAAICILGMILSLLVKENRNL